jgi:hypothetical protein
MIFLCWIVSSNLSKLCPGVEVIARMESCWIDVVYIIYIYIYYHIYTYNYIYTFMIFVYVYIYNIIPNYHVSSRKSGVNAEHSSCWWIFRSESQRQLPRRGQCQMPFVATAWSRCRSWSGVYKVRCPQCVDYMCMYTISDNVLYIVYYIYTVYYIASYLWVLSHVFPKSIHTQGFQK